MKNKLILIFTLILGFTFAQEKPARPMEFTATINGENIYEIKAGSTAILTIEAQKTVESHLIPVSVEKISTNKKDKSSVVKTVYAVSTEDLEVVSFKVLYEVSSFMLKIPGHPTQQIKGNILDLSTFSQFMKAGESWNIFNIRIFNPNEPDKLIEGKTAPVLIDIR